MRAVFNSSWQLLNQEEQQTLRRLSVFHGPFTRPAATAVTGTSLAALNTLVDHSLLTRQDIQKSTWAGGHFELLDVLRQYASEQLEKHGNEADQVRSKHATYYLQFLKNQQDFLEGSNQNQAVSDISQNIKQIRSAWRWAVHHQDIPGISNALDALGLFYYMRSWFMEGADMFRLATTGWSS